MLCLLVFALLLQIASACSVPVFRYGLEHWTADPYRVFIVHRGALLEEHQSLVKELQAAGGSANLSVQLADLAKGPVPEEQGSGQGASSTYAEGEPWIMVHPPRSARVPGLVWSGPLNKANIAALLDSPARRTIADRLGEGESAVFVLLESGDKAADDAAANLLESRLTYLASVLELPKLDEQDIRNGLVSVPPDGLRLAFSVVRISRSDPAEQAFIPMLLATESDLKETSGPIAFPVFGQGRALYALVGKGIKHETIDAAASFLIGSCSCQVKEKNPGADLLMAVNWKNLLKDQEIGLQDLPPASQIVKGSMPETVKIAPQAKAQAAAPQENERSSFIATNRMPLVYGGIVLCLVIAAGVVFMKRRAR